MHTTYFPLPLRMLNVSAAHVCLHIYSDALQKGKQGTDGREEEQFIFTVCMNSTVHFRMHKAWRCTGQHFAQNTPYTEGRQ